MLVENTCNIIVCRFSFVSPFISRYMTDRIEIITNLYTYIYCKMRRISPYWIQRNGEKKYEINTDNNKIESQNSFRQQQNYELLNDALELA